MKSARLFVVLFTSISAILLFNGCASISKSLGGVWYDPTLAISQQTGDERCSNLMLKNRDLIISFLTELKTNESFPAGWILNNKLREGGTNYRNLMGGIYLTIGIDRAIEYNADQIAGLMDSPRKRAEKDCEDGALLILKQFPKKLLEEDVNGVIFSMKHKVKEKVKQYGVPYDEVAEIVFPKDEIIAWKNMEIGTSVLLKKSIFIVNGTRL